MIDTIQIAHDLTAGSNLSQKDSEAVVQTIAKMQASELATKTDIAELKTEFAELKTELKTSFAELRTSFAEVRTGFAKLQGEVNLLRWMTATNLVLVIAVLVKLLFGH